MLFASRSVVYWLVFIIGFSIASERFVSKLLGSRLCVATFMFMLGFWSDPSAENLLRNAPWLLEVLKSFLLLVSFVFSGLPSLRTRLIARRSNFFGDANILFNKSL